MDEHDSLSKVAKDQSSHVPTGSNLAYGQVKREEGVGGSEYEMCNMPSGVAMATPEATYETIPT